MPLLPDGRAFVTADKTTGKVASGAKFDASQVTGLSNVTVYTVDTGNNATQVANPVFVFSTDPTLTGNVSNPTAIFTRSATS